MSSPGSSQPLHANGGIPALIETLFETERRLEELTLGEVDTVAGRDGRTFLLGRAQEQLRFAEAAKQTAILNALPADIALLDNVGTIVSVNEAWRQFARVTMPLAPGYAVGVNYLDVCDKAEGAGAAEAHQAAVGIRAVLTCSQTCFILEYPCDSLSEPHWFLMTVTPLAHDLRNGAVVMHLNISERKRAELAASRLAAIVESSGDAIIGKDLNGLITTWNNAAEKIFGYSASEMVGQSINRLMPTGIEDEHLLICRKIVRGELVAPFDTLRQTKDGRGVDISVTASPIKDANGHVTGASIMARDITQRIKYSNALRESEKRFSGAFEHAPIGMALVSTEGRWLKVNRALCELFGYSEDELLSSGFQDLTHPGDLERSLENVRRAIAGELRSFQIEKRYFHKRGHIVTAALSISLIRDTDGLPRYFISQIQDITERKRVDEALLASEAEFRALAEATPHMVWITRPDGWTIFFNRQWMNYTGLTLEESLGHGWNTPFHPEDRQRAWDAWEHATQTTGTYSIEVRLRRADGAYRWWLTRGVPQRDDAGHVHKWFGTCTDIHDLKVAELELSRANRELIESEEKFRQLAEIITDVFWITSADLHRMLYVSPGYESIWNRSTQSLYVNPRQWIDAILPEDRGSIASVFAELGVERSSVNVEYRISRPDGGTRWINDRGFVVRDAAGKVVRLAGIASDITERKKAEAELEKTHNELLETSRLAGMAEVATGILHNVGNVLNSVNVASTCMGDTLRNSKLGDLNRVAALMREHESDLGVFMTANPQGQHLAGYIGQLAIHLGDERVAVLQELAELQKNVEHIKAIVKQQQNFAKVPGIAESLKIPDLIEDALKMNAGGLIRHQIHVVKEFEDVPPLKLEKHKLLQILVNLIRNAKDACSDSTVDVRQLVLHVSATEHGVRIAVSDNGVGIQPENLTRIFAHGFTTKKEGHGFGLHSSVLAAQDLGGSLSAHSDGIGFGATFVLELPYEYIQAHREIVK